jgi:hypothetical protein
MAKTPVRRSKEEYQKSVSEARKRWKIKERTMKAMFLANENGAKLLQEHLLATDTLVCRQPDNSVLCSEYVLPSIVVTDENAMAGATVSLIAVTSTKPRNIVDIADTAIEDNLKEAGGTHKINAVVHENFDECDTTTVTMCQGFIRGGVSYAKFNTGGAGDIFREYVNTSK